MIREKGKLFDPDLLERFFQIMGVWPIGTIVYLNDKRIAVIREPNEQDIFNPKIEVIYPTRQKQVINLIEQKDKIQIVEALNPFGHGKKYLDLV